MEDGSIRISRLMRKCTSNPNQSSESRCGKPEIPTRTFRQVAKISGPTWLSRWLPKTFRETRCSLKGIIPPRTNSNLFRIGSACLAFSRSSIADPNHLGQAQHSANTASGKSRHLQNRRLTPGARTMELGARPPLRSVIYDIIPWREKNMHARTRLQTGCCCAIKLHKS